MTKEEFQKAIQKIPLREVLKSNLEIYCLDGVNGKRGRIFLTDWIDLIPDQKILIRDLKSGEYRKLGLSRVVSIKPIIVKHNWL